MAVKSQAEVFYPTTDFKPMGETDLHRKWMIRIIQRLERHFRGQRVYVSGDLLVYYVEGNPKKYLCPDAFVVKDCDPHDREIFKIWEERKLPNFILETTSKSTRRVDMYKKKDLYAQWGVQEYMLYDPTGDWLDDLLAYRLVGPDKYEKIQPEEDGSIVSEELGIRFQLIEGVLEMFDVVTGERLLTGEERAEIAEEERELERREKEKERREKEKERREKEKALRHAAKLEKELEQLRKKRQGK